MPAKELIGQMAGPPKAKGSSGPGIVEPLDHFAAIITGRDGFASNVQI